MSKQQVKKEMLLHDVGISLPVLFEPEPYKENGVAKGEPKYSMNAVVSGAQAKEIDAKVREIISEKFGKDALAVYAKPGGIPSLLKDGTRIAEEKASLGKNLEFLRGKFQFRCASGAQMPPVVISDDSYLDPKDGKAKWRPITKEEGVTAGSRGNVHVILSSYEHGQNIGVTAYLSGVQVTEKWSRDATAMFGEVPEATEENPFAASEY